MSKAKMATSIFGFPLPDAMAKAAEVEFKKVPKDVRDRFKTVITDAEGKSHRVDGYRRMVMGTKAMDFVDAEWADVSVVTSGSVDRDQEVVSPQGLDWTQFAKSPAVALSHNYQIPRVGKCLWTKKAMIDGGMDAWKAKTAYTKRPEDFPADQEWLPETTWFYVREGLLPSKSIGFVPLSIREFTNDEISANPSYKDAFCMIDKALILEYSVCMLGSNPDSLIEAGAKMLAKGIRAKCVYDALGIIVPDEMPSIDEVKIEEKKPEEKAIDPFVSAETRQKSLLRSLMPKADMAGKLASDGLIDRIYEKMGKV